MQDPNFRRIVRRSQEDPAGASAARGRVAVRFAHRLALALAVFICLQSPAWAQTDTDRALERRVKAAFLQRFIEFVTWPDAALPRADSAFVIGVIARDGMADELRAIAATRTATGRPIEIRQFGEGEPIASVQVLFIGDTERARVRELVRAAPRHALIVTESEGALTHGSVINFLLVEGRVRFEIALDAAEKKGLRLSSRLLAVAHAVRTGTP